MFKSKSLMTLVSLLVAQVSFGAICEIVPSVDGRQVFLVRNGKTIAKSSAAAIAQMKAYKLKLEKTVRADGTSFCEDSNPAPVIGTPPYNPQFGKKSQGSSGSQM